MRVAAWEDSIKKRVIILSMVLRKYRVANEEVI